jgi:hypothetical protein
MAIKSFFPIEDSRRSFSQRILFPFSVEGLADSGGDVTKRSIKDRGAGVKWAARGSGRQVDVCLALKEEEDD